MFKGNPCFRKASWMSVHGNVLLTDMAVVMVLNGGAPPNIYVTLNLAIEDVRLNSNIPVLITLT